MIKMKKNKFILASVAALMAIGSVLSFGSQAHTVQAAQKTIHTNYYAGIKSTALSYNVNGKSLSSGIKTNTTMKYYGNPRLIKGAKICLLQCWQRQICSIGFYWQSKWKKYFPFVK